jgi:hypothetical protein
MLDDGSTDKIQINSDILVQMRSNREEGELSSFQPVGDMGFRQAKDDEQFKPSVVMNAQAAAPQSMPHRSVKFYGEANQAAGNKIVEINTSN